MVNKLSSGQLQKVVQQIRFGQSSPTKFFSRVTQNRQNSCAGDIYLYMGQGFQSVILQLAKDCKIIQMDKRKAINQSNCLTNQLVIAPYLTDKSNTSQLSQRSSTEYVKSTVAKFTFNPTGYWPLEVAWDSEVMLHCVRVSVRFTQFLL